MSSVQKVSLKRELDINSNEELSINLLHKEDDNRINISFDYWMIISMAFLSIKNVLESLYILYIALCISGWNYFQWQRLVFISITRRLHTFKSIGFNKSSLINSSIMFS